MLSAAEMGKSGKDRALNLRKSLAWNSAFFTEEGVLDPSELSKITGSIPNSIIKPRSQLPSKANVESSSMMKFDKISRSPPLHNIEENLLSEIQAMPMHRSSQKKPTKLLSIPEASSHDGSQMPLATRKSSIKGIKKDVPEFHVAYSLEKGKTEVLQDASILKLSSSAPAPIQAKHSAFRMPSQQGGVEKAKTTKPLFKKDENLLNLKSCLSSSTKPPMPASHSGSAGMFCSVSQQPFSGSRLPPPIGAKPSALRMPSPSLGFFQQRIVTSSHSNELHETSQVPISAIPSLRRPTNLKHVSLSKHSAVQTGQQPKKAEMEIKHIDVEGTVSSNVSGRSNCLSNVAKEITTNCLSKLNDKTGEIVLGKPYAGRTKELSEETCSVPQINDSITYSVGSSKGESCFTSSEMHFQRDLDESNSKQLYFCAPFMNGDLIMHKDGVSSEKDDTHIEQRSEFSEEFDIQNFEEHTIIPIGKVLVNPSQDVLLLASEECRLQDDLQLCEQSKKTSADILNQGAILLKDQLNSVPYSEEWLAAIEAFGEDILEVKTGTVHNSPPDKTIPEPGPWSPVKRKAQDVGPFHCTKYIKKPASSDE